MTFTPALENSEQEFTERYAPFAARGVLYPQREGSPLLEFVAGGRVLYLFDRNGPYARPPGAAQVVVHGVLADLSLEGGADAEGEILTVLPGSRVEGRGEVLAISRRTLVVQARLPLVLSSFTALPEVREGNWVRFCTLPPLHGFTL
ncbi:hypothetical protein ACFSR9_03190 [Deinococcus taklimakanensis]|uniref:Uncharacterized protein n=1 Tax=Deinococcus taklimakanensis TaxID=536443 RepID=A0ABW5P257_9DEIO